MFIYPPSLQGLIISGHVLSYYILCEFAFMSDSQPMKQIPESIYRLSRCSENENLFFTKCDSKGGLWQFMVKMVK